MLKTNAVFSLCIALTLIVISLPVNAGETGQKSFSEGDLEKYRYPSDPAPASESKSTEGTYNDSSNSKDNISPELKKYVIPYTAYEGTARRIIIPVTFNRRITVPMLLDTGAPGMHISPGLAEKLGIMDEGEGKLWIQTSGIGGSVPAVFTIIDSIQVGEVKDEFIPTTISPSISSGFEGLIGMDFMANYSIKIDTGRHVIILEEFPSSSRMPGGHDEFWWRSTFHNFQSMKSAWKGYRDSLENLNSDNNRLKQMKAFAEQQYKEAQNLYNRLSVYASTHAVPREWR